jgi:hypothetical protein
VGTAGRSLSRQADDITLVAEEEALALRSEAIALYGLAINMCAIAALLGVLGGVMSLVAARRISRSPRSNVVDLSAAIDMVTALKSEADTTGRTLTERRAELNEISTALSAPQEQLQAIVGTVQPKGARSAWWISASVSGSP